MTTQNVLISWTLQDDDGDQASVPLYATYDDATVTLSDIVTQAGAFAALLDAITDVQIVKEAVTFYPALPGGLKSEPVASSDVEKTGLLTYNLTSPSGKAFGQDIPGLTLAAFVGDEINLSNTDIEDWITNNTSSGLDIRVTNNFWTSTLASIRKGVKSFRKLGKRP